MWELPGAVSAPKNEENTRESTTPTPLGEGILSLNSSPCKLASPRKPA